MLKQCLVSQLHTNYVTKKYFTNGLLFQDHILKLHDFFQGWTDTDFYYPAKLRKAAASTVCSTRSQRVTWRCCWKGIGLAIHWSWVQVCLSTITQTPWARYSVWPEVKQQMHKRKAELTRASSFSWPAQSLNINIIENKWLRLKNALQRNIDAITSIDELKAAITTAWMNVSNSYIYWLYNSIPRHLRAVVISKGNITKY